MATARKVVAANVSTKGGGIHSVAQIAKVPKKALLGLMEIATGKGCTNCAAIRVTYVDLVDVQHDVEHVEGEPGEGEDDDDGDE